MFTASIFIFFWKIPKYVQAQNNILSHLMDCPGGAVPPLSEGGLGTSYDGGQIERTKTLWGGGGLWLKEIKYL